MATRPSDGVAEVRCFWLERAGLDMVNGVATSKVPLQPVEWNSLWAESFGQSERVKNPWANDSTGATAALTVPIRSFIMRVRFGRYFCALVICDVRGVDLQRRSGALVRGRLQNDIGDLATNLGRGTKRKLGRFHRAGEDSIIRTTSRSARLTPGGPFSYARRNYSLAGERRWSG